ncbi:MAG: hypothetical protein K8S94_06310 [Planctomycetia bacterium]|nr:hypothetical protein [Planctomycetia bacterium]
MPFLTKRAQGLWVFRVMMVAGSLWAGVSRAEPPPPPREPRAEVPVAPTDDERWRTNNDEVAAYLEQLERHLDWMHQRAEWRKDSDTLAAVEAIQKKLAVAKEHHRKLCLLCAKELHDTQMARECCQAIDEIMHEVIDDHLALMRRLRARRPGPTRIRRIKMDAYPVPSLHRRQLARGS